jgi:hypothetical protein
MYVIYEYVDTNMIDTIGSDTIVGYIVVLFG